MYDIVALIDSLRESWRSLLPGTIERGLAHGVIAGLLFFLLIFVIERASGTRTDHYRTRGFAHDVAYYFYFNSGLQIFLVPVIVLTTFRDSLSFLDFKLLAGLPYPAQLVAWLLIADFVGYWVHRAKHEFPFLWAFHSTHHSQENITFITNSRVHPVEDVIGTFLGVTLLLVLGVHPVTGVIIALTLSTIGQFQHTQIPWRFGPLYWVFVTPPFHNYHHSTDPEHHDRNFGILFSFWDRLFGTAVAATAPKPSRFGLDDVKPTSLWSTLVTPFYLLCRYYAPVHRSTQSRSSRP